MYKRKKTMKKLEELRRRRGITGLLGCPSDTKDPDDWDWDNWDNWPQEDKDMFPIEEEENIRKGIYESMNESVLFVDKWQDTLELLPDCDNVWFIADGKIYIGLYEPEQEIFCMADGLGVPLSNVRQWKYVTDKEVVGYPKEKQIVAVDVPDFPCPVTGIFSDHLVDEETGDEFSGVLLDDEYTFCENGCDSIAWSNVFAWYPLPDEPLKVIDVDNDIDFDNFEFEFEQEPSEELPIEEEPSADEVADDIGPEPLPEVGPEPLPEIEPEESSVDTEKSDDEIKAEVESEDKSSEPAGDIFDTMEGVKRDNSPDSDATQDIFTTMDVSGNNMNSLEDALNNSEEEPLVKTESKKSEGERLTESEDYDSLDDKVKDWYVKEYPTDDMGEDIDPELTFLGVFEALDNYEDIYEVIGVGDSIIRERIFSELADRMGVDYDYVYDQWLRSADKASERSVDWSRIDPEWIEELYKSGQTTSEEHDTALENIKKARAGIYEAVEKKNPHVREARIYYDFPGSYRPWSGAVETWDYIEENDAIDDLERFIDEMYPDGIGETELNDLLWFDSDYVYESLGLRNPDAEDEEDEDEEEEEEELVPVSEEEYKGYDICEWYEDDEDPDPEKTYFTICVGNRSVGGVLPSKDAAKKKIDDGDLKESKSAIKAHKLNEAIRGNTKQFVQNVENWLEGFGDEIWEDLRVNIQGLQEYARYGTLNEAIREYVEGGSLDCYYDDVRKTLNELYENTPEEIEKWSDYPTDKLWERYINVMCLYIPKAYKKHTGKELDMRKDPESEYSIRMKARYGERKLSVGDYLYEKRLEEGALGNIVNSVARGVGKVAGGVSNAINNGKQSYNQTKQDAQNGQNGEKKPGLLKRAANSVGQAAKGVVNSFKDGYNGNQQQTQPQNNQTQNTQQTTQQTTQPSTEGQPSVENGNTETQSQAPAEEQASAQQGEEKVEVEQNQTEGQDSGDEVANLRNDVNVQTDSIKKLGAEVENINKEINNIKAQLGNNPQNGQSGNGEAEENTESNGTESQTQSFKSDVPHIRERGLTRAERHNKMMNDIFDNHRRIINSQKDFLRAKGVSDEELEKLDHGTGLSHDAIGDKIRDMGCWDEYWNTGKKVKEHLEHISDEAYGKWVKLKRKLDHEYLADYCLEALPKYEAELIIDYLADMNGIEDGDLNHWN